MTQARARNGLPWLFEDCWVSIVFLQVRNMGCAKVLEPPGVLSRYLVGHNPIGP